MEAKCLSCGGKLIKIDEIRYKIPRGELKFDPKRYICVDCHTYHKEQDGEMVVDDFRETEHQEYLRMVEDKK